MLLYHNSCFDLIFGFLLNKKSYRVLFIVSYVLTSGFGKDVKSRSIKYWYNKSSIYDVFSNR